MVNVDDLTQAATLAQELQECFAAERNAADEGGLSKDSVICDQVNVKDELDTLISMQVVTSESTEKLSDEVESNALEPMVDTSERLKAKLQVQSICDAAQEEYFNEDTENSSMQEIQTEIKNIIGTELEKQASEDHPITQIENDQNQEMINDEGKMETIIINSDLEGSCNVPDVIQEQLAVDIIDVEATATEMDRSLSKDTLLSEEQPSFASEIILAQQTALENISATSKTGDESLDSQIKITGLSMEGGASDNVTVEGHANAISSDTHELTKEVQKPNILKIDDEDVTMKEVKELKENSSSPSSLISEQMSEESLKITDSTVDIRTLNTPDDSNLNTPESIPSSILGTNIIQSDDNTTIISTAGEKIEQLILDNVGVALLTETATKTSLDECGKENEDEVLQENNIMSLGLGEQHIFPPDTHSFVELIEKTDSAFDQIKLESVKSQEIIPETLETTTTIEISSKEPHTVLGSSSLGTTELEEHVTKDEIAAQAATFNIIKQEVQQLPPIEAIDKNIDVSFTSAIDNSCTVQQVTALVDTTKQNIQESDFTEHLPEERSKAVLKTVGDEYLDLLEPNESMVTLEVALDDINFENLDETGANSGQSAEEVLKSVSNERHEVEKIDEIKVIEEVVKTDVLKLSDATSSNLQDTETVPKIVSDEHQEILEQKESSITIEQVDLPETSTKSLAETDVNADVSQITDTSAQKSKELIQQVCVEESKDIVEQKENIIKLEQETVLDNTSIVNLADIDVSAQVCEATAANVQNTDEVIKSVGDKCQDTENRIDDHDEVGPKAVLAKTSIEIIAESDVNSDVSDVTESIGQNADASDVTAANVQSDERRDTVKPKDNVGAVIHASFTDISEENHSITDNVEPPSNMIIFNVDSSPEVLKSVDDEQKSLEQKDTRDPVTTLAEPQHKVQSERVEQISNDIVTSDHVISEVNDNFMKPDQTATLVDISAEITEKTDVTDLSSAVAISNKEGLVSVSDEQKSLGQDIPDQVTLLVDASLQNIAEADIIDHSSDVIVSEAQSVEEVLNPVTNEHHKAQTANDNSPLNTTLEKRSTESLMTSIVDVPGKNETANEKSSSADVTENKTLLEEKQEEIKTEISQPLMEDSIQPEQGKPSDVELELPQGKTISPAVANNTENISETIDDIDDNVEGEVLVLSINSDFEEPRSPTEKSRKPEFGNNKNIMLLLMLIHFVESFLSSYV